MRGWPLYSYLELEALPASVRAARMHARDTLHEWRLGALEDTVELLVSELTTNAVHASGGLARHQDGAGQALPIGCWLTSDRSSVLIQVWDADQRQPLCRDAGLEAEAGRGLQIVSALCTRWGCFAPDGLAGKIVWALCAP